MAKKHGGYRTAEAKREADRKYYQANKERLIEYQKKYYQENKEKVLVRSRAFTKNKRKSLRQEAVEKLGGKCIDCGESNPIVLQFHHRAGEIKIGEVTALATSPERFWPEVEKCDLVCANHHLIRHSKGK